MVSHDFYKLASYGLLTEDKGLHRVMCENSRKMITPITLIGLPWNMSRKKNWRIE